MAHNFAQSGGYGHPGTYAVGHHDPPPQQQPQYYAPPPQGHYQGQQNAPPPQGNYQGQQNVFSANAEEAVKYFSPEIEMFEQLKSQRFNGIQAHQLKVILDKAPTIRSYYQMDWSLELCRIMIAMLDRSKDGIMQYGEFVELLNCLRFWHQTFSQYDHDRSRYIEAHELGRCITEKFKYTLTKRAMETLLKRYSCAMDDGKVLIALDDFVALSVRLRSYTEAYRARDRQQHQGHETGNCTFQYDDFLQCVMCL